MNSILIEEIGIDMSAEAYIENSYVPAPEDCDAFNAYRCEPDGLSDLDMSIDGFPMIEWDGVYGRHWQRFETEAERQEALNRNTKEWEEFNALNSEKPYEWLKKYLN